MCFKTGLQYESVPALYHDTNLGGRKRQHHELVPRQAQSTQAGVLLVSPDLTDGDVCKGRQAKPLQGIHGVLHHQKGISNPNKRQGQRIIIDVACISLSSMLENTLGAS